MDAERFFEILSGGGFEDFPFNLSSIDAEKEYLKMCDEDRKVNFFHNYAITYLGEIVGACGLKVDQHHEHIGEIGYFVEPSSRRKGIASNAVGMVEDIGFSDLYLERIEILMLQDNEGSRRVADRCGYVYEGVRHHARKDVDGSMRDVDVYFKTRR